MTGWEGLGGVTPSTSTLVRPWCRTSWPSFASHKGICLPKAVSDLKAPKSATCGYFPVQVKILVPGCCLGVEISLPAWLLLWQPAKLETSCVLEREQSVTDCQACRGDTALPPSSQAILVSRSLFLFHLQFLSLSCVAKMLVSVTFCQASSKILHCSLGRGLGPCWGG